MQRAPFMGAFAVFTPTHSLSSRNLTKHKKSIGGGTQPQEPQILMNLPIRKSPHSNAYVLPQTEARPMPEAYVGLRTTPNLQATPVYQFVEKELVLIIGQLNNWYVVELPENAGLGFGVGFIPKSFAEM